MRNTVAGAILLVLLAGSSVPAEELAKAILKASDIKGGLAVHVGCGDGKLVAALGDHDGLLVQGLDTDPANVKKARTHIQSLGLGGRVSVASFDGKSGIIQRFLGLANGSR